MSQGEQSCERGHARFSPTSAIAISDLGIACETDPGAPVPRPHFTYVGTAEGTVSLGDAVKSNDSHMSPDLSFG